MIVVGLMLPFFLYIIYILYEAENGTPLSRGDHLQMLALFVMFMLGLIGMLYIPFFLWFIWLFPVFTAILFLKFGASKHEN